MRTRSGDTGDTHLFFGTALAFHDQGRADWGHLPKPLTRNGALSTAVGRTVENQSQPRGFVCCWSEPAINCFVGSVSVWRPSKVVIASQLYLAL